MPDKDYGHLDSQTIQQKVLRPGPAQQLIDYRRWQDTEQVHGLPTPGDYDRLLAGQSTQQDSTEMIQTRFCDRGVYVRVNLGIAVRCLLGPISLEKRIGAAALFVVTQDD